VYKYLVDYYNNILSLYELSGKDILEIGCGCGDLFKMLNGVNPNNVIGVDVAPVYNHKNILQMSAEKMLFEDEVFDFVFSVSTFEHIANPLNAMNEIHRVLKPNGEMYIRFAPVWTAPNGHHYNIHTGDNPIIPPWGHLYMNEDSMNIFLKEQGITNSGEICKQIYQSEYINRWRLSDYLTMLANMDYKFSVQLLIVNSAIQTYSQLTDFQKSMVGKESIVSGLIARYRKN